MPAKKKAYTYKVSQIDIDGDGIPDGDLIEEIDTKTGQVIRRKFVSSEVLQNIVSDTKSRLDETQATNAGQNKKRATPPKRVKSNAPGLVVMPKNKMNSSQLPTPPASYTAPSPNNNNQVNQVMVADNTSFGKSLSQSFAWGIGMTAGSMLVEGVVGLFAE